MHPLIELLAILKTPMVVEIYEVPFAITPLGMIGLAVAALAILLMAMFLSNETEFND